MDITEANFSDFMAKIYPGIEQKYIAEQEKLANIARDADTEGQIRAAAGNLVENLLAYIFDRINEAIPNANIESKVGSHDYLSKTIKYKDKELMFNQIQVDRHVWSNGKRIAFIENKTYLDSCYYDRALADFKKIAQSLQQQKQDPGKIAFIVFAGQDAASERTILTYEAEFWYDTKHLTNNPDGIVPKVFYFLKNKRRSDKPLYKIRHELHKENIYNFVRYIIGLI